VSLLLSSPSSLDLYDESHVSSLGMVNWRWAMPAEGDEMDSRESRNSESVEGVEEVEES
jgi:hypothetical protein